MVCKMKVKKTLIFISILFMLFLSLSTVQAKDVNETSAYAAEHVVGEKTFDAIQTVSTGQASLTRLSLR